MNERTETGRGAGAAFEVLGQIQTDRACVGCGFNLFGQTIVRDEHYGLPIARCPECGRVCALQEYPGLGAWARRWGALLGAAWLLVAVGLFALLLSLSVAPTGPVLEGQVNGIAERIAQRHQTEMQESGSSAAVVRATGNYWSSIDEGWAESQDFRAMVRRHGPVWRQLDKGYPTALGFLWLMVYGATLAWPVVLVRAGRWRVAAYGAGTVLLGGVITAMLLRSQAETGMWARSYALGVAWPTLVGLSYPVLATAALASAFTGRVLARTVIRAALPPRYRLVFAELWRADGKEPGGAA
ncbi:MAG: hypothetical protein ACF8Q5_10280 [Phycisphaerales bacterium JB040]